MNPNPRPKYVVLGDGCTDIMQILRRQEEIVVLRGTAKQLLALQVAEGLAGQCGDADRCLRMYDFWKEPQAIIGRRFGTFIEGDPDYLGLAVERVWHRYPGRN